MLAKLESAGADQRGNVLVNVTAAGEGAPQRIDTLLPAAERIDPLWSTFAGGCHINKDIPALVRAGGFELREHQQMYIPGPKIFSYNYWGVAVASR